MYLLFYLSTYYNIEKILGMLYNIHNDILHNLFPHINLFIVHRSINLNINLVYYLSSVLHKTDRYSKSINKY